MLITSEIYIFRKGKNKKLMAFFSLIYIDAMFGGMETNVDAANTKNGLFCKYLPADLLYDVIKHKY